MTSKILRHPVGLINAALVEATCFALAAPMFASFGASTYKDGKMRAHFPQKEGRRIASSTTVGAISATYRCATKKLPEALNQEPTRTRKPSADFDEAIESIPEAMREKALEWYERGIKRGMKYSTDRMREGLISFEDGVVFAPAEFEIKVKVKMNGRDWESRSITVRATDIGFILNEDED